MLFLTAVLVVLAAWIWCSGSVLLVLVVVLLRVFVVLFATTHWAALIIRPILNVVWALDMVSFHPA
jgi:hypothetical protein